MNKRVAHNKLLQEDVIAQFIEVHGDEFDYSKVVYINTNTPVEVYCKKHNFTFTPTPKNHKNGAKCTYCGREEQIKKAKKDQCVFLKEMFDLYEDSYDYSKMNYINSRTDVEILCKKHGIFKKRPCELVKEHGCPKCKEEKSKYNNRDLFAEENIKIFGDITDFQFVDKMGADEKVTLICTKHTCQFTLSVSARLSGQKCPKCSAENYRKLRALPKEEYYKKANEVYNYEYTYLDDFTTSQYAITFYCKDHGKQRRNSFDHLRGAGCRVCEKYGQKKDKLSKEGYINSAKGRITTLYLIKCEGENESFYKIGKTFRGVKQRFKGKLLPYKYEIVKTHDGEASYIWDLEEMSHKKFKEYSYKPNKFFSGFSECYNLSLPIHEIIKI
jgi:cytochrome c2